MPFDIWDGAVIEYISETQNFAALKKWFFDSAWFLQYFYHTTIIKISEFFKISYKNMNAIFVFFYMFILLREISIFSKQQLNLKETSIGFACLLVASCPVWTVMLSSIMSMHLFCFSLGVLSVRLIHSERKFKKIFGFIFLIASFTLKSLLVFLPVLSFLYDISKKTKKIKKLVVTPSIYTILIFIIGLLFYLINTILFPPQGIYGLINYNNLAINDFRSFIILILDLLKYCTYFFPVIIIAFLINLSSIIFSSKHLKSSVNNYSTHPGWLIWLIILFIAGVFPYAAVGKATLLWDVTDWNSRQAILVTLPIAIFTALYFQILFEKTCCVYVKKIILIGGFLIFIFQVTLLVYAVIHKHNRQIFELQLQDIIKPKVDKLNPGLLQIIGDGIPNPVIRSYESNYLMYRVTGETSWWSAITQEKNHEFHIPCHIQKDRLYQQLSVYNHNNNLIKSHIIMKIKVSGFKSKKDIILNSLGLESNREIKLISIDQTQISFPTKHIECN